MSLLIVGIDGTIVNVALPAIRRELHASLSGLQWSVDAYTLVIASFLMASGSWRTGSAGGASSRSAWPCSRSGPCCAAWRRTSWRS